MKRNDDRPTSRGALLVAGVVSVVLGTFVPFGGVLLYPFTLLATWVHEMGHGLTALAVGGSFERLEIFADASGLAHTRNAGGTVDALVCLGGLVAPAFVGAAILATCRGPRRARVVLVALAALLVGSLAVWVRSVAGVIAIPLVAGVVVGFVVWGSPRERMFLAQFLGLRLALDTLGRGMDYLFSDTATVDGTKSASDIARVAQGLGGPRLLWSIAVAALCVVVLGAGLFAAWRRAPGARATAPRPRRS